MNFFDELRHKFMFLTFLTDQEIENLMSIVRSVAVGTSVSPDEILQYIDQESSYHLAYC
jgi:hypothetical protein